MKTVLKSAMVSPRNRVQRRINFANVFPQIKTVKVEVMQRNSKLDVQAKYVGYDETTLTESPGHDTAEITAAAHRLRSGWAMMALAGFSLRAFRDLSLNTFAAAKP